ncbi:MAG: phosphoglycerate kinase [Microgenomates group bacterium]
MIRTPVLRSIHDIPPKAHVIVRIDMDEPMKDGSVTDDDRLKKSIPTIKELLEKQCVLLLLGHVGRPKGKDPQYSLGPIYRALLPLIRESTATTVSDIFIEDVHDDAAIHAACQTYSVLCFENVRFWEGEEQNDPQFLQALIHNADWYVNDALAVSHRRHRSVQLHHDLPTSYGIAFIREVQELMHVVENPTHPVTVILGGAKKDKLTYVAGLAAIADHVLIGGKLPHLISSDTIITDKFCIAALSDDGFDLNKHDIEIFTSIIKESKTIIWAGAMGFFENPQYREGTEKIARAVVASGAYTILAGGDTEASVSGLGEEEKITVIASGGGMMLELLTKKSLPAWE